MLVRMGASTDVSEQLGHIGTYRSIRRAPRSQGLSSQGLSSQGRLLKDGARPTDERFLLFRRRATWCSLGLVANYAVSRQRESVSRNETRRNKSPGRGCFDSPAKWARRGHTAKSWSTSLFSRSIGVHGSTVDRRLFESSNYDIICGAITPNEGHVACERSIWTVPAASVET